MDVVGAVRGRASVKLRRTRRLGVRMRLKLAEIWGELNVTTSAITHRGRQDEGNILRRTYTSLKNKASEMFRDAAGKN